MNIIHKIKIIRKGPEKSPKKRKQQKDDEKKNWKRILIEKAGSVENKEMKK